MCELTIITRIFVSDAAVQQEAGNVGVVKFVWSVELCRMIVHPNFELLLWSFLAEMWWSFPLVEDTADTGVVGVVALWIG